MERAKQRGGRGGGRQRSGRGSECSFLLGGPAGDQVYVFENFFHFFFLVNSEPLLLTGKGTKTSDEIADREEERRNFSVK